MFLKRKSRKFELTAWQLAIESSIRQAIEVYTGQPVRFEYLNVEESPHSWTHSNGGEHLTSVSGMLHIDAAELAGGPLFNIEARVSVSKLSGGEPWLPRWNGFDLALVSPQTFDKHRFCAWWQDRGGSGMREVRVHRFDSDNLPISREETYRFGTHIGDRRHEQMPLSAFGRFAAA